MALVFLHCICIALWPVISNCELQPLPKHVEESVSSHLRDLIDLSHFHSELAEVAALRDAHGLYADDLDAARNPDAHTLLWITTVSRAQLCLLNNHLSWVAFEMDGRQGPTEKIEPRFSLPFPVHYFVFTLDRPSFRHCEAIQHEIRTIDKYPSLGTYYEINEDSVQHKMPSLVLHCIRPKDMQEEGNFEVRIGDEYFMDLNWAKQAQILVAQSYGFHVLASDLDIVHLKNPLQAPTRGVLDKRNHFVRADSKPGLRTATFWAKTTNTTLMTSSWKIPVFAISRYKSTFLLNHEAMFEDSAKKNPRQIQFYANAGLFFASRESMSLLAMWYSFRTRDKGRYEQHAFNFIFHLYDLTFGEKPLEMGPSTEREAIEFYSNRIRKIIGFWDPEAVCACSESCTKRGAESGMVTKTRPEKKCILETPQKTAGLADGDDSGSNITACSKERSDSRISLTKEHFWSLHYSCDDRENWKQLDMQRDGLWRPQFDVDQQTCNFGTYGKWMGDYKG